MATPPIKSCMRCTSYLTCTDKQKNTRGHYCIKFKRLKEIEDVSDLGSVLLAPEHEDDAPVKKPPKKRSAPDSKGASAFGVSADEPEFDIEVHEEMPDNFILDAMQRAYDPHTNTVRDLRVDDTQLKLAKNYYDYCANLSGTRIKMPFARQLWICLMLMGEMCPKCTHPKAQDMFNIPVDLDPHKLARSMTLLEYGVCPKCRSTRHSLIQDGLLNDYYELVFVAGQRSGKSTVAATLVTYMLHRYLKSPKLSSLATGIQDFTPLTMSFVALTVTKALKLLWVPIRDMIGASQWFEDYFALLDRIGRETGRELYQFKPTGTYCRVFHKSLELMPEGPSKRNLRGATRACAVTDELGWFPYNPKPDEDADQAEERERANADEVYTALDNSLATVRTAVPALYAKGVFTYPQAMNLNLSSPASWKDKIMRLWKESQDSKLALGVKAATWDISPMYTRDHPFIVDKFNRNARNAARDFGAEPPALSSTIFDRDILAKLFNQKMWYRPSYENHVDKTVANLVAEFEPQQLPPAVLSLDAGVVNNSFALTLLFKAGDTYVTPLVLEVIPEDGKPINFPRMYAQVIKPIIQSCNVRLVVSDRWNSIYVLDQIREDFPNKVITRQITLKTADFKEFRALVASGQLLMPELELGIGQIETATDYRTAFKRYAASHLFSQFLTIQEIAGMFYKGEGATDDILRSLIVASTALLDAKLSEYMRSCQTIDRSATSTQAVVLVGSRYGAMSVLGWNRY